MTSPIISDGQLLAYLDGVRLPEVEKALLESPDLRARLETLRREEAFLRRVLPDADWVDPQDMVDVVMDQASAATHLRVNAYLKTHPEAQEEMARLKKSIFQPSARSTRPIFPASPILAAGLRAAGDDGEGGGQTYYAAELDARVSLRTTPDLQERWRISGRVTCAGQAAAYLRVNLSSAQFRPRPRQTDMDGFFEFQRLPSGCYTLRVAFAVGTLLIAEICLNHD